MLNWLNFFLGSSSEYDNIFFLIVGDLKQSLKMDDASFSERYARPKPHPHDTNIVFAGYGPIKSSAALEIAQKMGYKK